MRKLFTISFCVGLNVAFAQIDSGNVGINTTSPYAKLDILSLDNTQLTNSFRVSNSVNQEVFTVNNGNFVGLNTTAPISQLEINSLNINKSVLKITPMSSSDGRQNSSINYNTFSPVATDTNGNMIMEFDIKSSNTNAISFDGSYTTSGAVNKILCAINKGSIVRFTVWTGFVQGQSGIGVVKYADITWSAGSGFRVMSSGYDYANTNPNSFSITGVGTNILTFDVLLGDDLIFQIVGGNLVYRQVDSTTGVGRSEGFNIMRSFRSR